jgi:hypothetical protein
MVEQLYDKIRKYEQIKYYKFHIGITRNYIKDTDYFINFSTQMKFQTPNGNKSGFYPYYTPHGQDLIKKKYLIILARYSPDSLFHIDYFPRDLIGVIFEFL